MKVTGRFTIAFILLTLLNCTGCSWIFMKRAPDEYKNTPTIECSGKTAPNVDLVIAGSHLLSAVVFLIAAASPGGDTCTPDEGEWFCLAPRDAAYFIVPVAVLGMLIHGFSAWSGYCWADECKQTRRRHNRWLFSISPEKRLAIERQAKEERCEKLKSRMSMVPSPDNQRQYISVCGDLIRARANKPDRLGQNELHRASRESDWRRVRFLLTAGVGVHARDKYGWTPLHYAASTGNERIVKMLLAKGANPLARDNENQTPIHVAYKKKHGDLVKLLKSRARKQKSKRQEALP